MVVLQEEEPLSVDLFYEEGTHKTPDRTIIILMRPSDIPWRLREGDFARYCCWDVYDVANQHLASSTCRKKMK